MNNIEDLETSMRVSALAAETSDRGGEMVVAKVPQGYDTRINIRFVPGRDIQLTPAMPRCNPRQTGGPRRGDTTLALPEVLIGKLRDANRKVSDWLARDNANAQLFLEKPVEALQKAGIELTRAEQKALHRSHGAATEERVVAPGVRIAQLAVSASAKGRISEPVTPRPKSNDTHSADGCGCESGKKE